MGSSSSPSILESGDSASGIDDNSFQPRACFLPPPTPIPPPIPVPTTSPRSISPSLLKTSHTPRCCLANCGAVGQTGTRLRFLRGGEIYVDTDWAIMEQIHAVFEPASSRGQYLTRRHARKGRHRRKRAPKVGYLLPLNCLRF